MSRKKGGKIVAVIEIGSDMVTMLIAQNQGGKIVALDRLEYFFDLEKEIATTGRISQPSILELSHILGGFKEAMAGFGVEQYKLFSTDFIKRAENAVYCLSQLTGRTGMKLEIIDDDEEKSLLYWRMQRKYTGSCKAY